jgi:hypothetical protein
MVEQGFDDLVTRHADPDSPRRQRVWQEKTTEDGPSWVYMIRLGDRVKIGFTTNLRQRMYDLPHEEILAVVPGTVVDERRCHAAFAHLRVAGEWFRAEPELLTFAQDVDARGGVLDAQ